MAHSKTSICNSALLDLGRDALVVDADGDAPQQYGDAAAVVEAYDRVLGRTLRSHNWNFAEVLAELEASTEAPVFGYARKFAIPSDWAGVWNLDEATYGPDPKYRVRGGFIETDYAAPLRVVGIRRITDPSLFDDEFAEALAAAIAAKAALKVLGSKEAARVFRQESKDDQADARSTDAKENPAQEIDGGSWLVGRVTG